MIHRLIFFPYILTQQTSHDPTSYVQRARVTRAAPPKPACNPLQFIQIKPCNLYQSAQEQLKRAEEVKKVKEVKKEEPEDWQSVSTRLFFFFIFQQSKLICNDMKKVLKSRSVKLDEPDKNYEPRNDRVKLKLIKIISTFCSMSHTSHCLDDMFG